MAARRPIEGMRCTRAQERHRRFLAHVEVFAHGRVVLFPAGVGIAPPHVRRGAFVIGGRCEYPLRTREPTGLVEIEAGRRATLGDLFALLDQPLSRDRLLAFQTGRGRSVAAFVGSRRFHGDPRRIPLRRHSAVTLEVGRLVPPHVPYAFPPGPPAARP